MLKFQFQTHGFYAEIADKLIFARRGHMVIAKTTAA